MLGFLLSRDVVLDPQSASLSLAGSMFCKTQCVPEILAMLVSAGYEMGCDGEVGIHNGTCC